jgi:rubrerythrin
MSDLGGHPGGGGTTSGAGSTGGTAGLGSMARSLDVDVTGGMETSERSTTPAEILDGLNDLLQFDHDAVGAYQIAIEKLHDRDHADQIAGFRRDHERHIRELNELIAELGGTPKNHPHATGPFKLALQSLGSLAGDKGVLMAFRTNELAVRTKYDSYAAKAIHWPARLKRTIDAFALDEERHFRWVSDLLHQQPYRAADDGYSGLTFAGERADDAGGEQGQGTAGLLRDTLGNVRARAGDLVDAAREKREDLASRVRERLEDIRSARAGQELEYVEVVDLEPGRLMDQAADALERAAAELDDGHYGDPAAQERDERDLGVRTRARMSEAIDGVEAALTRRREAYRQRIPYARPPDDVAPSTERQPAVEALAVPERMEARAREVRHAHGLHSVPVDPLLLARTLGIDVHHAQFVDAALVSTVARRGERASILVQHSVPAAVRRIAIAHALGHYVLHLRDDGGFVDREVDLYRWTPPSARVVSVRIRDELEANLFAHALLMPEDGVAHAMERHPAAPIPELAILFQVPRWLAGFRLAQLGY